MKLGNMTIIENAIQTQMLIAVKVCIDASRQLLQNPIIQLEIPCERGKSRANVAVGVGI